MASRHFAPVLLACSLTAGGVGYGCRPGVPVTESAIPDAPAPTKDWPGRHVMVVINGSSPESAAVGNAYALARKVPRENIVIVGTTTEEEISLAEFRAQIEFPVGKALKRSKNDIDYIVTTFGMPIRIGDQGGYSFDAFLAQIERPMQEIEQNGFALKDPSQIPGAVSPYFGKNEHFSRKKFGFYLVTRLSGDTLQDALRLIDLSLRAKPASGPFLLDSQPLKPKDGSYGQMERILAATAKTLRAKGLRVVYDQRPEFASGPAALMGYASWGSNDDRFSPEAYARIRFAPGGIAETFVSTSARTLHPAIGGQSLINDLLKGGATGVKGYVSEPFTFALAHTNILFDRYTAGFNLAESYAMASPILKWKDIVLGDPLLAPYEAKPYRGTPALPIPFGVARSGIKRSMLAQMGVGRKPAPKIVARPQLSAAPSYVGRFFVPEENGDVIVYGAR